MSPVVFVFHGFCDLLVYVANVRFRIISCFILRSYRGPERRYVPGHA